MSNRVGYGEGPREQWKRRLPAELRDYDRRPRQISVESDRTIAEAIFWNADAFGNDQYCEVNASRQLHERFAEVLENLNWPLVGIAAFWVLLAWTILG